MITRTLISIVLTLALTSKVLAFDLQGHRGARGLMPENTLPAFAKALSIGVSTLELDTGVTRDGVVVISHDPALNPNITRDANGTWLTDRPLIKELTFEALQSFDVGAIKPDSRTAKRFPNQQKINGTRIPSLEELFQLVASSGNPTVRFNIETKINPTQADATIEPRPFATALIETIRKHNMLDRVSIQSFDWRTLQIVQEMEPNINTVYLTAQQNWLDNVKSINGTASFWTAGFNLDDYQGEVAKMIKAAGGKVWSPYFQDLNKFTIEKAQKLGLNVIPWTVNDEATMLSLIDMGVDGIITDYPDVLRQAMSNRGMQLPKAARIGQ